MASTGGARLGQLIEPRMVVVSPVSPCWPGGTGVDSSTRCFRGRCPASVEVWPTRLKTASGGAAGC
jgi:hypothetical protein